jgi:GT2 family glycosyltransferase
MLVRTSAIRQAGLLDPDFFMYFEETEWCARLGRAGNTLWIEPRATVWHAVLPNQHLASRAVAYYMTRNQLLYLKRTRAPVSAWVYVLSQQLRTLALHYVRPRGVQRTRGRGPMVRALRDFSRQRFGRCEAI